MDTRATKDGAGTGGSETQGLWQRAKALIPGGTQLLSKRPELHLPDGWPAYARRAQGVEVVDLDGRRFIDVSICAIGACPLGFADPDVDAAAVAALAAEPGPGPQELGMALAEVIICDKVGTCEGGHSEVVLACVERANALRADIRRSCQRSGAPGARPQSLGGRQPLPPPPPAPNR